MWKLVSLLILIQAIVAPPMAETRTKVKKLSAQLRELKQQYWEIGDGGAPYGEICY